MSDKTNKLSEKIKAAKLARRDAPTNIEAADDKNAEQMSVGMRLSIELLAGIITGAIIGYFFDYVFGTIPLFLIIFLLLGAASGFWTVYKLAIKDESGK
jgi:ATP synthase protein I